MANLFIKQAKQYLATRPTYPPELYEFIASKTPCHDLVWDVGTGSGQAVRPLSEIYKKVVATDTSLKQIEYAPNLPNVRFQHTPPSMSNAELQTYVAPQSTVDLVTIAQAMHWFDLPELYDQVKWVLKKPHGVIAAWCYTIPKVNDKVDAVFDPFYKIDSRPYWEKARDLVDDEYRNVLFSFEPVDGLVGSTGPFEFVAEKVMSLEDYITYIKSWSAYNTAMDQGAELLSDGIVEKFRNAWGGDGSEEKVVRFPIFLRIGRVGNSSS